MRAGPPVSQGSQPQYLPPGLSDCERELIHIPGTIQPHGILFALRGPELRISAVSANIEGHLGGSPATLLNRPLAELIDAPSHRRVAAAIALGADSSTRLEHVGLTGASGASLSAFVHTMLDGGLLELKLWRPRPENAAADLFDRFGHSARRLQGATDTRTICARLAQEIRRLTGYDRVKVYRFTPDYSGEVVAEENSGNLPSYLGLHFPASDIPAQARALYVRNLERQIPDVDYIPVSLVQSDAMPIDLSQAVLRSVSPIHLEYLRNMQVAASMSVSIVRDGALWGLVACHHATAHYVAPELRQACVLLAQIATWQLALVAEAAGVRCAVEVNAIETKLLRATATGQDYHEALLRNGNELLDLMQASGMALSSGGSCTTLGDTPPEPQLSDLLGWLMRRGTELFETDHLAAHYPPASELPAAAGILAVALGSSTQNLMVWFRPEIARTVTWGGNPAKPIEPGERLSPRRSFAAWTETVRGHARPWARSEVAAANSLRDMIVNIILRRSLELERINTQLVRTNEELEAFAYIASHDLKEPLRQIETFGTLLERAMRDRIPAASNVTRWFEGIQASSRRLRFLINDLAEYSRLGRHARPFGPTALSELIEHVKTDLGKLIEETNATIETALLPVVMCDPIQMQQVFQNVIANALKYRHPDRTPTIRINAVTHATTGSNSQSALPVLEIAIADNGIGFDERHRERIFEPFQRLHGADDYEGSGIGLAICRKIIDRHGGTIVAAGRPDEGAVFTLMLPLRPLPAQGLGPP